MNKSEFKQHWHNIRSTSRPRKYGVPLIVALKFAHTPKGEMAYGWEWGHLSKMQQPFMKKRKCPDCGIIRKKREVYLHWEGNNSWPTCCHCHPEAAKCQTCGCYCSPDELARTGGYCFDCVPSDTED